MKTHRFDPVSLLLGIAVIVLGISAINARLGTLANDRPDALIPLLLSAAGIAAIAVALRRSVQDVDRTRNDQHDGSE